MHSHVRLERLTGASGRTFQTEEIALKENAPADRREGRRSIGCGAGRSHSGPKPICCDVLGGTRQQGLKPCPNRQGDCKQHGTASTFQSNCVTNATAFSGWFPALPCSPPNLFIQTCGQSSRGFHGDALRFVVFLASHLGHRNGPVARILNGLAAFYCGTSGPGQDAQCNRKKKSDRERTNVAPQGGKTPNHISVASFGICIRRFVHNFCAAEEHCAPHWQRNFHGVCSPVHLTPTDVWKVQPKSDI
jgi:hypothetical protein